MHWFDDFTKSVAGKKPTRSAMLDGLVRLAAGAALAPAVSAVSASPAAARTGSARSLARATTRMGPGVRATLAKERVWAAGATVERGPCSITAGPSNSLTFSATASSLTFTMTNVLEREPASRKSPTRIDGHFTVDITDGDESLLHVSSRFSGWHAKAQTAPHTALSFRYGARITGIKSAELTLHAGKVGGTVDGRTIEEFSAHEPLDRAHLSARHMQAEPADAALRTRMEDLTSAVKTGFDRCRVSENGHRNLRNSLEHKSGFRDGPLRSLARDTRAFDVAQVGPANGYIPGSPTGQNTGVFIGENTPNCYNAFTNAGSLLSGCIATALAGGWLCPPCMAYAIFLCYGGYTTALAAMEIPGGACEQVPCSTGSAIPNSCDYSFTCCGNDLCCPSSDFCTPGGFCCSSSTPLVCGTNENNGYCCSSTTVCGQNGDCVACPDGQVPQNGQCCNSICGSECCQSADATCDQAKGKCVYPNFGTPAPTSKPNQFERCLRSSGNVTCRAYNEDNSSTYICCSPHVNCCAGTCCQPGETCGGTGQYFGCGRWIK